MTRRAWTAAAAVALLTLGASSDPVSSSFRRSSPIAMSMSGELLAVVNPDSNSISLIEPSTPAVREIPVGRNPQTAYLSDDARRAYVTNAGDDTVAIVDLQQGAVTATIRTCRDPFGVVAHDRFLYVSCFADSRIAILDTGALEQAATIEVELDPRGVALSPDGRTLYVTHFTSGKVTIINTETRSVETVITTGLDTNLSQALWIDASAERLYLPQTRSNASNPALLFDTTVFPIVSVVDLKTRAPIPSARVAIDIADRPVGIPIDAVVTSSRKLYVVHAASNDLSVIDLNTGFARAHLGVGDNPRGLAISPDEKRLYVANTLAGTISVVDAEADRVLETIKVTDIPLPPSILRGKRLFNSSADPRLAKDRWISCASCHFDGTMDRRTWFFRDGPRNTPSLMGVADTLPVHWSGDLDELQDVESTIRTIQAGMGLAAGASNCEPACNAAPPNAGRSGDLDDLAAFMRSLRFQERQTSSLSERAERGRAIFFSEATGCASCHRPAMFTDRQVHDVGTAGGPLERKGSRIDTPSLRGLARTAPYLHDGSAATLREVLTTANPADQHGRTSHLSAQELDDLVAFLAEIPINQSRPRPVRR